MTEEAPPTGTCTSLAVYRPVWPPRPPSAPNGDHAPGPSPLDVTALDPLNLGFCLEADETLGLDDEPVGGGQDADLLRQWLEFQRVHTSTMLWEAKIRPGERWPYWGRSPGRIYCWEYIPEGMVPTMTRLADGAIHQLITTPVWIEGGIMWLPRRGPARSAPGPKGGPSPAGAEQVTGYLRGTRDAIDTYLPVLGQAGDFYVGWLATANPWALGIHLVGLVLVVINLVVAVIDLVESIWRRP